MSQQNYTTTGTIEEILPKEERGGYSIQKVVLSVEGYKDRKEFPCFEFFGSKSDAVDQFRRGDECEITFNLSGRENKGRWFTTLSAWKIVRPENGGRAPSREDRQPSRREEPRDEPRGAQPSRGKYQPPPLDDDDGSDIPF